MQMTHTGTITLWRGDGEDTYTRSGLFYAFDREVALEYGDQLSSIEVDLEDMTIVTLEEAYEILGETDTASFGMILTDTNSVQVLAHRGIDAVMVDDENDLGTEHESLFVVAPEEWA